jgi:hypothetical protein
MEGKAYYRPNSSSDLYPIKYSHPNGCYSATCRCIFQRQWEGKVRVTPRDRGREIKKRALGYYVALNAFTTINRDKFLLCAYERRCFATIYKAKCPAQYRQCVIHFFTRLTNSSPTFLSSRSQQKIELPFRESLCQLKFQPRGCDASNFRRNLAV